MKDLRFSQLAAMPTVLDNKHESLYRSYHTLQLVKDLLEKGTPSEVVLGIIGEIENLQSPKTGSATNIACTGQEPSSVVEDQNTGGSCQ